MFINQNQLTYEHPLYTLFQSFYIGWIRGMLVYDNPLAPCTRLVAQFNQTETHYIKWIWKVSHFWRYVKLKWATIIGVKGDLCKYVASQSHVYEGKATRFVIFLFMWPRPLVEMVGFIISKPKSCLRLLWIVYGLSTLVFPIHMQIGNDKHTHCHFTLLYIISLTDFKKPFPIRRWP